MAIILPSATCRMACPHISLADLVREMDVDTKGGSTISISYITSKPILYVGAGQGYDDL